MSYRMLKCAGMLVLIAWPFAVYALHGRIHSGWLLLVGALLLVWRLPQARRLAMVAAAVLLLLGLLGEAELGMRAYPVAVSLILLAVFAGSLFQGMPVIERLARFQEPDLPPEGVRYTRKVTWAWCGFFIVNGGIAAWTALYADLAAWTLYNGCISYLLMGLMFAVEWLCRRRVRRTAL